MCATIDCVKRAKAKRKWWVGLRFWRKRMWSLFNLIQAFPRIPGNTGGSEGIQDARKNCALTPRCGTQKFIEPQYIGICLNNFRAKQGFLAKPNCPECINIARYRENLINYGIIPVDVVGEIQNKPFGALKRVKAFVAPFVLLDNRVKYKISPSGHWNSF